MWIIEYEASGIDKQSYPLYVGIFNGTDSYYSTIKPLPEWTHWDYSSQAIHHLKRLDLVQSGKSPPEVAQSLNHKLVGETVYCDSDYWDDYWNKRLFDGAGLQAGFEIRDLRALFEREPELISEFYRLKHSLPGSMSLTLHHALDDAKIIWHALDQVLTLGDG